MARALAVPARGESPTVQDLPSQDPGPGQARVTVQAASVNGIDAFAAAGYVWDSMPHEFPVVLGRDFAGIVDAVGDGVTGTDVGDAVAGVVTALELFVGTIAEQVIFDATELAPVPSGVTPAQAAAVGLAGISARDLVDGLGLTGEDVVLVSGATGGVGALAVQLAAGTGATVLATARPGAESFVRGLGAAHAVDYTSDLAAAVREVAPEGVTAVVHTAGDPAQLGALLRPGGRLASVVGATDEQVGRADVTVIPVLATSTPAKLGALVEAVASGSLQVPIAETFPIDDAPATIAAFASPKLGKIVVSVA